MSQYTIHYEASRPTNLGFPKSIRSWT